ncbi:hypothetical protein [Sporosarcina sp. ITBMC105]
MKKIFTKAPMMFIITAAIFGGAATTHYTTITYYFTAPHLIHADPLWVRVYLFLYYTIRTTIPYAFYFVVAYYLLKFVIVKTYNRFAKR